MDIILDYRGQSRGPTVSQIVSDWGKLGHPAQFGVRCAEMDTKYSYEGFRWTYYGNAGHASERQAVVDMLHSVEASA